MKNNESYHHGLLNLIYLLIGSDKEISEKELGYLEYIKMTEGIPDHVFGAFNRSIIGKKEKEIYQNGIDLINSCPHDLKLRAFVKLYNMAQSDGVMHVKEVRLLLYAVKLTDVDINSVISLAVEGGIVPR
jgi:hypothetical protein